MLFLMVICHQPYSELENIPIDLTIRLFVRFIKRIRDIIMFLINQGGSSSSGNSIKPDGVKSPEEFEKISRDKRKEREVELKIHPSKTRQLAKKVAHRLKQMQHINPNKSNK